MEQLKPQTLQQTAYREIKRRIVTLLYQPGEQINTAQICSQLSIGRTPVHLAIHRLETEGLIEILPRRGIVVRAIDRDEIMSLIEARHLIEPQVAALAAVRASEREFALLRSALDRVVPCIEAGDHEQFMMADLDFHRTLAEAARNPPISEFLAGLHERCLRMYFLSVSRDQQEVRILPEHEEIFAALVRRDADAASETMRRHIASLRNNLRDLLEQESAKE